MVSKFRGGGVVNTVRGCEEFRAKENLSECPAAPRCGSDVNVGLHAAFWCRWSERWRRYGIFPKKGLEELSHLTHP